MEDFFEQYIDYCVMLSQLKPRSYLKYSDGMNVVYFYDGINNC
jgi:hypothetical protein